MIRLQLLEQIRRDAARRRRARQNALIRSFIAYERAMRVETGRIPETEPRR